MSIYHFQKWLNTQIFGRRISVSDLRRIKHHSHRIYIFFSLIISAIKFYVRYDDEDNVILQLFKIIGRPHKAGSQKMEFFWII